jgi:hypothetical protein
MSYQVGAAKITKIPEIVLQSFIPEALFPDLHPDVWTNLPEWMSQGLTGKPERHSALEFAQLAVALGVTVALGVRR